MPEVPAPKLDMETAIGRMGDKETYLEIVGFFTENLPTVIFNLEYALDHLPETETVEPPVSAEARRLAHSLKSNCAMIGADELRAMALNLEQLCNDGEITAAKSAFAAFKPHLEALHKMLQTLI